MQKEKILSCVFSYVSILFILKGKNLLVIKKKKKKIVQSGNSRIKKLQEKVTKCEVEVCLVIVYRVRSSVDVNDYNPMTQRIYLVLLQLDSNPKARKGT